MLSDAQWTAITSEAETFEDGRAVLPALQFMRITGCRPQEVRTVEASHVNHRFRFVQLGPARELPLDEVSLELLRARAEENPDGPLFRDADGRPWTSKSMGRAAEAVSERADVTFCYYDISNYRQLPPAG